MAADAGQGAAGHDKHDTPKGSGGSIAVHFGDGGMSGSGGHGSTNGSGGRGSPSGSGGSSAPPVCGAGCPGFACAQPLDVIVQVLAAQAGTPLGALSVEVDPPAFSVICQTQGASCQYNCRSMEYHIPDGDYTVTFRAPGYDPQTIELHVQNQTNCGCCGCCPWSFTARSPIELAPNGEATSSCCDTQSDVDNCGACGNACGAQEACARGACHMADWAYKSCGTTVIGPGAATCNTLCGGLSKWCVARCGPDHLAYATWPADTMCATLDLAKATVGTSCDDPLAREGMAPAVYCCCADP